MKLADLLRCITGTHEIHLFGYIGSRISSDDSETLLNALSGETLDLAVTSIEVEDNSFKVWVEESADFYKGGCK